MSMPAKATATVTYIGRDRISITIRTWLAQQKRNADIYFCAKVKSDNGGIMEVAFESDSEGNLCWQLETFCDFLRTIKEVKKMDSEVWILGYGSSFDRMESS